jgi:methyltransferase (TIGR00027 family)
MKPVNAREPAGWRRILVCAIVVALQLAAAVVAREPKAPSKTAIWVAAGRAIGAKQPNEQYRNPDYLAIKFVGPRERAILSDYPLDALDMDYATAMRTIRDPDMVRSVNLRTHYFDAALQEALALNIRQIVILGAGFDSRGYRFADRLGTARFFEVDEPSTLEYKKMRVKEIFGALPPQVRYAPVDFTKDDLLTQLTKAGYAEQDPTLFIWEGVTYYLPERAVRDTLRFVRNHSATRSRIAFDYVVAGHFKIGNPNTTMARWGEPFVFGFPGERASEYVRREGLDVVSDETGFEYLHRLFPLAAKREERPDGRGGYCTAAVPARQ